MAALSITAGPLVTPIAEAGTSLIKPAHRLPTSGSWPSRIIRPWPCQLDHPAP